MSLNEGMAEQYAAYRVSQYTSDRTQRQAGLTLRIAMTKPAKTADLSHASGRLRWARERRFKTQADFCRAEGLAEGTYRHHENGIRNFGWQWALRYAQALNVDADWILAGGVSPGTSQKSLPAVTIPDTKLASGLSEGELDMGTAEKLLEVMKDLLKTQQAFLERSEVRYEDLRMQNDEIIDAMEKILSVHGHTPKTRRPKPKADYMGRLTKPS